jgi:hypothetical protein
VATILELHDDYDLDTLSFRSRKVAEDVALQLVAKFERMFEGVVGVHVEGSKKQFYIHFPYVRDMWMPKSSSKEDVAGEMLRIATELATILPRKGSSGLTGKGPRYRIRK